MAVTITQMTGSDNVGLSRLTINANFNALKAVSDALTLLLDPIALSLTGIKYAEIDNAAAALSSTILSVSKSASILGNASLGTVGASTSVSMKGNGGVIISEGSLTIGVGNLTLSGGSSLLTTVGAVSFNGEIRVPGVATSFVNTIGLTSASGTNVTVSGIKYLAITNNVETTGLTATLPAGSQGQEIEIYHVLGPSGGPVNINASNFIGLTGGIKLQATGDKIKCIYDTAGWYLWDQNTGLAGTNSIVITRI